MPFDRLTPKQEKLVQGVFSGLSQREAYKQAYPGTKMKIKTMDETACRLMKHEGIIMRMNELTTELKERNMVTAEKVIEELAHIAFADISDYLDYRRDEEGNIKVEIKDSKRIDTRAVSEVSTTKDGTFKFKMYAKDQALIALGKHLGFM
jgi:phage terminase small subunit